MLCPPVFHVDTQNIHSHGVMQAPVQRDLAELRVSLGQRFPIVPAHKVDEVITAHGSDEDACIAHLLAAAYNEGGSSACGQVSPSFTYARLPGVTALHTANVSEPSVPSGTCRDALWCCQRCSLCPSVAQCL